MTNDYTAKIYQVVEYLKRIFPELTINLLQALETILHEGGHYSHFKNSNLSPDNYMETKNREFFANEESKKIRKELNI